MTSSTPTSPLAASVGPAGMLRRDGLASPWLLVAVLVLQFACQLGLVALGDTALRLPLRVATFGVAWTMTLLVVKRQRAHPSFAWAVVVMAILPLGLLHPEANTLKAGLAQIAMYGAILSPLLWVAGIRVDAAWFRRIVLMLWGFAVAGAVVGALQTRFPQLQPSPATVLEERGPAALEGLTITLADGARVFRPMGLTDSPGGAAGAGMIAIVLGAGILVAERNAFLKLLAVAGMGAGIYCILLSQVRSILVMTAVCLLVALVVLAFARRFGAVLTLLAVAGGAIAAGAALALTIGGAETLARLQSLVADDPGSVYYTNRGHFLHHTLLVHVPQYPFGAGLGRWGMMNHYFGTPDGSLWAEIQWTGWIFDGGLPLTIAYVGGLLVAMATAWRIAMSRTHEALSVWAAIALAYGMSFLAVTFNYPVFLSEGGLQFWLLNATLFAAWQAETTRARQQRHAELLASGGVT